jgi:nitrogen fixation protein
MNPSLDFLKTMLKNKSHYGATYIEGIVIKNYDFVNKYGRQPYAKLLNEKFQEVKTTKKVIEPDAILQMIAEQYVTTARVEKICNKIKFSEFVKDTDAFRGEKVVDQSSWRLEMKHIPQVINMVWYDVISEDMNDICKKFKDPTINFKLLKRLVFDRAKEYFVKSLKEGAVHEGKNETFNEVQ